MANEQRSFFDGVDVETIAGMNTAKSASALPIVKQSFGSVKFVSEVQAILNDSDIDPLDRQMKLVALARKDQAALINFGSGNVYKAVQTMCNRIAGGIAEEHGVEEYVRLAAGKIKEVKRITQQ